MLIFNTKKVSQELFLFAATVTAAFFIIYFQLNYLFLILTAIISVYILSYHLAWGAYLLVLTFPFVDWSIYLTANLNPRLIDIVAIIISLAYVMNLIRTKSWSKFKLPFLGFFCLFLLICLLSLFNSYFLGVSVTFLIRSVVFSYLMFLVLPYNIIKDENVLYKIIWLLYLFGVALSLAGLASFVFNFLQQSGIPRALPPGVGNFYPLGSNQNLLAETLTTIIPLGLIISWRWRHYLEFYWLNTGILLMALATLLTFSRAGWIVLLLELLIWIFYVLPKLWGRQIFQEKLRQFVSGYGLIFLILILPCLALMYQLLQSPESFSSNHNRLAQWQNGMEMFKQQPLIGTGIGTFLEIINHNPFYQMEYGGNLDAHGVALKLIGETGILGLVSFFLFLGAIFYKLVIFLNKIKNQSESFLVLSCLLISVIGSLTIQMFNTTYFTAKLWLPLGLLLAAYKIYGEKYATEKKN